MSFQLVICICFASEEAAPFVHGNNFSPGRSFKNKGTSIIRPIVTDRLSIDVAKLYLYNSQLPTASEADVPMIFEPHINPLAFACCDRGTISMAIPSVATSWKAPKKLMAKAAILKTPRLFNGS